MQGNPLLGLETLGQSVWLDFLSRNIMQSGELRRLIDEDGLSGITANPTNFEKVIAGSDNYDEAIRTLTVQGKDANAIYETLATEDVRRAADRFRPVYDRADGTDGFVSLEVSPHLAYDTEGTIREARHLWAVLDRPNVMIKVPGTRQGLPAIRLLTSEGINVNVTLLFGLPRYREVVEAYLNGLEDRLGRGDPLTHIASVASFFLSRIDVSVDPMLEQHMGNGNGQGHLAESLHGQVATASAKIAYQISKELFAIPRFRILADAGAHIQRLLWASTGTKNPAYGDVKYVEALIGPDTVNTMPLETLRAYRDHGNPQLTLEGGALEAHEVLEQLPAVGIDLDRVTQQLEDEGVQKFTASFDKLMQSLGEKAAAVREASR